MHPKRARMLQAVSERLDRTNAQVLEVRGGDQNISSIGQVMILGVRMAEVSLLARAEEFLTPESELTMLHEKREQEGQII